MSYCVILWWLLWHIGGSDKETEKEGNKVKKKTRERKREEEEGKELEHDSPLDFSPQL